MPNPLLVPAILGMAGSIGSSMGSYWDTRRMADVAARNTDLTIKAQKEQAELAYQRSQEMWHMQNAYNSPEEQMKRFGAAGLNPHLIYGQGSAGNASTQPQYQAPNLQYRYEAPAYGAAVTSALPMLMQVGTWMQNMRLTENKIAETDQLVEFLKSRYPHQIREFDQKESLWPYQKDMAESKQYYSRARVAELLEEFRHKYGPELDVGAPYKRGKSARKGIRELERMLRAEQARKTGLEADWLSPTRVFGMVNAILGRFMSPGRVLPRGGGRAHQAKTPKRY